MIATHALPIKWMTNRIKILMLDKTRTQSQERFVNGRVKKLVSILDGPITRDEDM